MADSASERTQYGPGLLALRRRQGAGWTAEAAAAAPPQAARWASGARPLMGWLSEFPVLQESDGILPVLAHSAGMQQTVRLSRSAAGGGGGVAAGRRLQHEVGRIGGSQLSSIGSRRSTPSMR